MLQTARDAAKSAQDAATSASNSAMARRMRDTAAGAARSATATAAVVAKSAQSTALDAADSASRSVEEYLAVEKDLDVRDAPAPGRRDRLVALDVEHAHATLDGGDARFEITVEPLGAREGARRLAAARAGDAAAGDAAAGDATRHSA